MMVRHVAIDLPAQPLGTYACAWGTLSATLPARVRLEERLRRDGVAGIDRFYKGPKQASRVLTRRSCGGRSDRRCSP